ncbi:MAG: esterase [Flavobacteriales bacterium]|nr:MAG: esterase [Flavobacteriales bacterium]
MKIKFSLLLLFHSVLLSNYVFGQIGKAEVRTWEIEGNTRKAMVYMPKNATIASTPVVFAFHGHGGTMENMFRSRGFEKLWPEAIVICPQGLNTPGALTDPEGKQSGWQKAVGVLGDRDLKFFDAMLIDLKKGYKVDEKAIFVTGHSNGGGFTYLLWAERGNIFAGLAPTATVAGRNMQKLIPKPVLHLFGEKDQLVKVDRQKLTCQQLLKLNNSEAEGVEYARNAKIYNADSANPVVIYASSGGHSYPLEATAVIVKFFKQIKANG